MKLFVSAFTAVTAQTFLPRLIPDLAQIYPWTRGINAQECFTCNGTSIEDCEETGSIEKCMENEQVCEIEIRRQRGRTYRVAMGCKWRQACEDNKIQNFKGPKHVLGYPRKYEEFQCHNNWWWKKSGSVCRQCCDGNANCGLEFVKGNTNYDVRFFNSRKAKDGNGPRDNPTWNLNLYWTESEYYGKAPNEIYDL